MQTGKAAGQHAPVPAQWPGDVGIGEGVRSADLTAAVPGSDAQHRPARPPGRNSASMPDAWRGQLAEHEIEEVRLGYLGAGGSLYSESYW